MTHDQAVQSALLTATKLGARLFRREVGLFTDLRGTKHLLGIKGEADLQGILPPGGWAFAVEVKTGRAVRTKQQVTWSRMWLRMGGLYVLARYSDSSDGDATIRAAVRRFLETKHEGEVRTSAGRLSARRPATHCRGAEG
jgi:hypothetical protein